jgi:hypothetical protein
MRDSFVYWGVRIAGVVTALVLAVWPLVAAAQSATLGPGWIRLGPITPRPPDLFAVDPTWPFGRLVLGARQPLTAEPDPFYSYVVRSTDGGEHWEILHGPGTGVSDVQIAPGGGGVVFLVDGDRFYGGQHTLYRSADAGSSWQAVLQVDPSNSLALTLSPAFGSDQLAFVVSDGQVYRSRDGGASFDALELTGARQVVFASDQRIFVVTDDTGESEDGWRGVRVSTDGGETWQSLGTDGLADADGEPMLDVLRLVASPSFQRDATLFAIVRRDEHQTGVFRSQDGGTTWQLVAGGDRTPFGRTSFSLALSPTMANDHFAVLAENYAGGSPASHNCRLQTSTDGGVTWVRGPSPGSYESCLDLSVARVNDRLVASAWKSYAFLLSLDGSAGWSARLNLDDQVPQNDRPLQYSRAQSTGSNGSYVIATTRGLMAIGGGVQGVGRQVRCEPPTGGFGRLWQSDASVHDQLGCPLEPERAVRIREMTTSRGARQLWTEDDQPRYFELLESHTLFVHNKGADADFPSDHTVNGATQRFEGGVMLWLPEVDGRRSIVVTRGNSEWREFPD